MKMRVKHIVPLSEQAVAILGELAVSAAYNFAEHLPERRRMM